MTDIQKLSELKTVSKIVHCADIHIRNLRRHDEYKRQFNKFYDEVKKINIQKVEQVPLTARMITEDTNIVEINLSVQYRIAQPVDYLLKVSQYCHFLFLNC